MLAILFFLGAFVALTDASSSETCIFPVSTTPVPTSVETVISEAEVYAPSLTSIGSVISTFELSSPSLVTVETVIEDYEQSYSSLVRELESIYSYSSLYTDETAVSDMTAAYSTLAYAVSQLVSAEVTQTTLAEYQSTLQSLEAVYTTLLTDLSVYTEVASPSVFSASQVISAATLTDSSILASVIAVSTAVSTDSTVAAAMSYLSSVMYTLPSTIVTEIITIVSSPSTVGASTVSSLQASYSTIYSQLVYIEAFTDSYPSIVSDLTGYLSAAASVSSLGSAASILVYYQMPTFYYEVSVLSSAESTLSSLTLDLQVLTAITAESPTLHYAEETIEGSFYSVPSVAYSIYEALAYPELVSSPSAISSYEESHESLVSAIDDVLTWESVYSSYSSTLASVESALVSVFSSYRTLLTAFSYVQDVTSPSLASATALISSAKTIVSDLTYILSNVAYITERLPSLSCDENVVEYYAVNHPSIASYIWSIYDGVSVVPSSSIASVESLIAAYSSLDAAAYAIADAVSYYSSLLTIESSFIYAARTDSSLLTQFNYFSAGSSQIFSEFSLSSATTY